jgi:hypothetical protein
LHDRLDTIVQWIDVHASAVIEASLGRERHEQPAATDNRRSDGLLKRHDYDAEVLRGTPAVHYVHEYQTFQGILIPTQRRVLGRRPDGTSVPAPLIVTIDLSEVEFS